VTEQIFSYIDESLDLTKPFDVLLRYAVRRGSAVYQRFTNLLFLVLNELGDKQSEIVIDATLLEVADELLLNADVQSFKLFVPSLESVNGVKVN
jgi:hypothetical protein